MLHIIIMRPIRHDAKFHVLLCVVFFVITAMSVVPDSTACVAIILDMTEQRSAKTSHNYLHMWQMSLFEQF